MIFLQNLDNFNKEHTIFQISRIQNSRLYDAHIRFEDQFMKNARQQYPESYRPYLWHATSEDFLDDINQFGFRRNYKGKNCKELLI